METTDSALLLIVLLSTSRRGLNKNSQLMIYACGLDSRLAKIPFHFVTASGSIRAIFETSSREQAAPPFRGEFSSLSAKTYALASHATLQEYAALEK